MEPRALQFSGQPWDGTKRSSSTFSPAWDQQQAYQQQQAYPCPDLVRSRCQHSATIRHPNGSQLGARASSMSAGLHTATGPSAFTNKAGLQGPNREGGGEAWCGPRAQGQSWASEANGTAMAVGLGESAAMGQAYDGSQFRARSLSASTPTTPHRQGNATYASPRPLGSPEVGGGEGSRWSADLSEEGARWRSRSRSIILKKNKRRPDPPLRSVSLRRDGRSATSPSATRDRDGRTQSLYLPTDGLANPTHTGASDTQSFLPDLILISKPRAEDEEGYTMKGSLVNQAAPLGQPPAGHTTGQAETALSPDTNPYCTMLSGVARSKTVPAKEPKVPRRPEYTQRPLPLPPTQTPTQSPSKPPSCPSSGSSSPRGEPPTSTPASPATTPTSLITGPSPLGCRMRPKPSSSTPRARTSRLRLSLELPATSSSKPNAADPAMTFDFDPAVELRCKATRRHSDSSAFTRPRPRLSSAVAVLPVVTQEELRKVRLRSVSSSESERGLEGPDDVISEGQEEEEEEEEEEEGIEPEVCVRPPAPQGPKARPPVAAKPPLPKWLPCHSVPASAPALAPFSAPVPGPTPMAAPAAPASDSQGDATYMKVRRPKPKRSHQPSSRPQSFDQLAQQQQQQQIADSEARGAGQDGARHVSLPDSTQAETLGKKRPPPPPVPRKPNVVLRPSAGGPVWSGPRTQPAFVVDPGAQPAFVVDPGAQPAFVVDPGAQPAFVVDPGAQPAFVVDPGAQPAFVVDPGAQPAFVVDPGAQPSPRGPLPVRDGSRLEHSHRSATDGLYTCGHGEDRSTVNQMRRLGLGEEHEASPPMTEDLFTIIHRSKKKLLSTKDPVEIIGGRQSFGSPTRGSYYPNEPQPQPCYNQPHSQPQSQMPAQPCSQYAQPQPLIQSQSQPQDHGFGQKSKNESFMAFLQRRRSNKPSERVSAAELLKTKPLTNHVT